MEKHYQFFETSKDNSFSCRLTRKLCKHLLGEGQIYVILYTSIFWIVFFTKFHELPRKIFRLHKITVYILFRVIFINLLCTVANSIVFVLLINCILILFAMIGIFCVVYLFVYIVKFSYMLSFLLNTTVSHFIIE